MATQTKEHERGHVTLVGFHDLLGFGELLASSGGTLDSAVGELAYRRIVALRASVAEVEQAFPIGTMFFHFNDTVTAYLDVDVQITSSHTDPAGIGGAPISPSEGARILHFISGCANLHQRCIGREEEERIGPAGRTFVVLGRRWELDPSPSGQVFEIPPLQANLAFAEAYLADSAGSNVGFSHRSYYRMYVNDYTWFILNTVSTALTPQQQLRLGALGAKERPFPDNLCSPNASPISVDIFHRRRTFYSLMSHHTCKVFGALEGR
jgi:hypothetical protein